MTNRPASAGKRTLRMTASTAAVLLDHMRKDQHIEQMAFALARHAKTAQGTLFLIQEVILPDEEDLEEQSPGAVCPTTAFQSYVYQSAHQSGTTIVEFHTHPGSAAPHFSGIDEHFAHPNGKYISENFPEPTTLVMVVGNNRFDAFDGICYDRHRHDFRQLDRLEVLGKPTNLWPLGQDHLPADREHDPLYARQQLVPGWNQAALQNQRIAIVGAGGNGAPLLQTLVGIGAGKRGFIVIADDDSIELSNLPRIPYADEGQVHVPKVLAAASYSARKSPSTPIYPFPCRFHEPPVLERMKMATVIFYCGDNDGGRKEVNDFAVRYGIPLIDLGCDVEVSDDQVFAGGQIRLVLPGENACLVCCHGFDPAQAAIDQMTDAARAQHANQGYLRGADAEITPSVANLNGLTVQFAVSQFLAIVNGERFAVWDYLHFDEFTGRTIPASTNRQDQCPLCGPARAPHGRRPHEAAPARATARRTFDWRSLSPSCKAVPPDYQQYD